MVLICLPYVGAIVTEKQGAATLNVVGTVV
jgi:hypothetical protein